MQIDLINLPPLLKLILFLEALFTIVTLQSLYNNKFKFKVSYPKVQNKYKSIFDFIVRFHSYIRRKKYLFCTKENIGLLYIHYIGTKTSTRLTAKIKISTMWYGFIMRFKPIVNLNVLYLIFILYFLSPYKLLFV